jgi:1-acyl-sn-glycerol-3-phosphate acyltransferase
MSQSSAFELQSGAIDRDPTSVVLRRRLVTVPSYFVLALLSVLAAPLWIPVAAVVDLARPGRQVALRCCAFFCWYLQCQCLGLVGAFVVWLVGGPWTGTSPERYLAWNRKLQYAWAPALVLGAGRIFDFRIETTGEEALEGSPVLMLSRHASMADTLLPTLLIQIPTGLRLRYVMKRELLWDPCIDVVGNRLLSYFVRRGSDDVARETRAIAALVDGIGEGDGVLIFPEGTRFTPEKRRRVLERLRERGESALAARAEKLEYVLPPKPAGTLALLEHNPGADALFCVHTGLEGAGSFSDLWRGAIVGKVVRVHFWRVPYREIPVDRDQRIEWLFQHWTRVDEWVAANRA